MSCSIKRFKCDTYPEKIVNTENVKKLNNDLSKLMAERSLLDAKYFPQVMTSSSVSGSVSGSVNGTIIHAFQTSSSMNVEKKEKKE
jgi:hypothetical protein